MATGPEQLLLKVIVHLHVLVDASASEHNRNMPQRVVCPRISVQLRECCHLFYLQVHIYILFFSLFLLHGYHLVFSTCLWITTDIHYAAPKVATCMTNSVSVPQIIIPCTRCRCSDDVEAQTFIGNTINSGMIDYIKYGCNLDSNVSSEITVSVISNG